MKKSDTKVTCLNIECAERKSFCCQAKPLRLTTPNINAPTNVTKEQIKVDLFACSKCYQQFVGGKCNAMEKVNSWIDDCDWRKEFDKEFMQEEHEHDKCENDCTKKYWENCRREEKLQFIEDLLIKILAEMETAEDARACRHILKEYILNEVNP